MPIFSAMRMISCLSKPITGRRTGRSVWLPVTRRVSMVWLATWLSASPVTRAPACRSDANRVAISIIALRESIVVRLGRPSALIFSWISVKLTQKRFKPHVHGERICARVLTFSSESPEVYG